MLSVWVAAFLAHGSSSDWSQRAQVLQAGTAAATQPAPPAARVPPGAHDYVFTAMEQGTAQGWRGAPGWSMPREVVHQPRPEHYLLDADIPTAWDWRSVSLAATAPPISFVPRVRNQFLPVWCGSCWAHAATAVMGSRWRIHGAAAASTDFSVQYLVNCVTQGDPIKFPESMNHSDGCNGGSSYGAFALAHQEGVVDSSCLPYTAKTGKCNAAHTCLQHLSPKVLEPVAPVRYKAAEFGFLRNESAIQKEIFARGPVSCCMACPAEFEAYTNGDFPQPPESTQMLIDTGACAINRPLITMHD